MEAAMARIKFFLLLLLILIPFCLFAQTPEKPVQGNAALDASSIERLAGFCRLWGLIKFSHPYLAYKGIDWDAALIKTLPLVREAKSAEDYQKAVTALLSYLKDPATFVKQKQSSSNQKAPIALNTSDTKGKSQPYIETTDDGIAVVVANDYSQFANESASWVKVFTDFQKVFGDAVKSSKVLVDLRNLKGDPDSSVMGMAFSRSISLFLKNDAMIPPLRFLSHEGYPSQRESTFAYHSDLSIRSGGVVRSMNPSGPKPAHVVFLLNKDSGNFHLLLAALQDSAGAIVVHEGEINPAVGIPTTTVDLPDSLTVQVRCAEILRKDGGFDFQPDLVVASDAREAGLEILREKRQITRSSRTNSASEPSLHGFTVVEKTYPEMTYPDLNYRLLALFRFWNIIDRFYPYKELMDQPWDKTLPEFLPKMEGAKDASEYALTVAELLTRIQDSHGTISSPLYSQYRGTFNPAVQVTFIEGRSVITQAKDPSVKEKGIEVGDIVLAVDGEKVEDRRARLKRVTPASTVGRLEALVDTFLLAGKGDNPAKLIIQKASGEMLDVELPRKPLVPAMPQASTLPPYTVLPSGFGYIDLGRIVDDDVGPALETIKSTPAVIMDMRGYPIGGTWLLASRMAKTKKPFAVLEFPEYSGEAGIFSRRQELQYVIPAPDHFDYKGKIVVLIHGSTQSAAEHTCLLLETVADVTFLGSSTSGADGNMTYTYVPGNIGMSFTGMGVSHADGGQLQRKGIQPQVRAEPTIAGIRQGRDEILERAVAYLKDGR
jgi:C-terminal processing protease CtpA/Prc